MVKGTRYKWEKNKERERKAKKEGD